MYKVLIIEDDVTISSIIEKSLQKWGFTPKRIEVFSDILTPFHSFEPHLILLDINLPYYDGFYWCTKIRELSNVPIMFISSRDTDADKIRAITQGGDDYIEKPFSIDLLIAKIQATLRRSYSYNDETLHTLQYKDLLLHLDKQLIVTNQDEIELTKNESKILAILIQHNGNTVTRSKIMQTLWDNESFVDDNTLTVNITRLRRKLKEINVEDYIKTVKGEGYRLS
ncbi:response regulator transcription factor [Bacillus sp. JCM 19034]|uniref:response regulator transcription factor n=1 Tax=Bacillus sp. JCM 19034 TaxID=1481928 RepID=UPI0007864F17|nr:response regulator transcription factor [Bacillus sp. JCM 19034]